MCSRIRLALARQRMVFRVLAGVLLSCAVVPSHAAAPDRFAFENAEVHAVIAAVAKLTGTTFVFDPSRVKGKITLIAPHDVSPAEALELLRSALAMHGYALVPRAESTWIVPAEVPAEYAVRAIPLQYADAYEVASTLVWVAPPGVRIAPYLPTNSVILSGHRGGVDLLEQLIRGR